MTSSSPTNSAHLTNWECRRLLDNHTVGRICIIDGTGPLALPISYRIFGSEAAPYVVLRTYAATSLGRYSGPATLEVDEISEAERKATSVLARGTVRPIDGPHQLTDPQPWVTDHRDQWMILDVTSITGRRFVAHADPDGFAVEWQFGG